MLDFVRQIPLVHYARQEVLFNSNSAIETERSRNSVAESNRCLNNLQQGNYTTAISDCTKEIEHSPENLEARLNLGLANYHQGNYQRAIAHYQFVIQQNPYDYRAFYNWGLSDVARGKYRQGIERYNTALNSTETIADGDKALILNDLGAAQILLKQYEAAIANLDLAIKLDPDSERSHFNRGCAYHHQGNYLAGINDFSQVIQLDSNYTEAYISRAILYHLIRHERAAYQDLTSSPTKRFAL